MFRRQREIDPQFAPDERLFLRCTIADCTRSNGTTVVKPSAPSLRVLDQSFNRQRYSKVRDVLLPDDTGRSMEWVLCGVAVCTVESIPEQVVDGAGVICNFCVEHDPLEDNYSHTELRAYTDGVRRSAISNKVKKECKTTLALKMSVKVAPRI
jgi:hypothetical protein